MNNAPSPAAPAAPKIKKEGTEEEELRPSSLGEMEEVFEGGVRIKAEYSDDEFEGHVPVKAEHSNGFAGYVPQDAIEGTVESQGLFNYPFLDELLPLEARVRAFDQFEEERLRLVVAWDKDKKACEECGKTHAPPHFSKEQQISDSKARKTGRQLRNQLKQQGGNAPKSNKAVFCKTCKKYHPGGAQACTTPLCRKGCNLHHLAKETCADAATRFANVEANRMGRGKGKGKGKASASDPLPPTASDNFDAAKFTALFQQLDNTPENMAAAASLLNLMASRKRSAGESASPPAAAAAAAAASSKKQKKGGAESSSPAKQSSKGSDKPDGKGKGKEEPSGT